MNTKCLYIVFVCVSGVFNQFNVVYGIPNYITSILPSETIVCCVLAEIYLQRLANQRFYGTRTENQTEKDDLSFYIRSIGWLSVQIV